MSGKKNSPYGYFFEFFLGIRCQENFKNSIFFFINLTNFANQFANERIGAKHVQKWECLVRMSGNGQSNQKALATFCESNVVGHAGQIVNKQLPLPLLGPIKIETTKKIFFFFLNTKLSMYVC